jgi:hypothetical protein
MLLPICKFQRQFCLYMAKWGQSLKFSPVCKTFLLAINTSCTKLLSEISHYKRVCIRYTMRCAGLLHLQNRKNYVFHKEDFVEKFYFDCSLSYNRLVLMVKTNKHTVAPLKQTKANSSRENPKQRCP